MPRKKLSASDKARRKAKRKALGRKIVKGAKQTEKFLRKSKLISKTAGALATVGVPKAAQVSLAAKQLGYGNFQVHSAQFGAHMRAPKGIKV